MNGEDRPQAASTENAAEPITDERLHTRSLVVAHQDDAIRLTGIGVPATTPASILQSDDAELLAYFEDQPAQFLRPDGYSGGLLEAEAMAKCAELGVTVKVVRP